MILADALRPLAGDGLANVGLARAEVLRAMARGPLLPAPPLADALDARALPSTGRLGLTDRVLAVIDQDGFPFAAAPEDDAPLGRVPDRTPAPRHGHRVEVVLAGGLVCTRKTYRAPGLGARAHGQRVALRELARKRLWGILGAGFWTEAAALLRLQALPFVPRLRGLDVRRRVLLMDFVPGEDLRRIAAAEGRRRGEPVVDSELAARPDLAARGEAALGRRELALAAAAGIAGIGAEVAAMVADMRAAGVAPLDVKPGNLLRGAATGRLYWLDFERARLRGQPRWEADLEVQAGLLRDVLGVSL